MSEEDIVAVITRHTLEVMPNLEGHDFQRSDSLKDLGCNSIDRSEIIMMALESLSLRTPLIELAMAANIGDLARILHEKNS